jgi:hypothetical protein
VKRSEQSVEMRRSDGHRRDRITHDTLGMMPLHALRMAADARAGEHSAPGMNPRTRRRAGNTPISTRCSPSIAAALEPSGSPSPAGQAPRLLLQPLDSRHGCRSEVWVVGKNDAQLPEWPHQRTRGDVVGREPVTSQRDALALDGRSRARSDDASRGPTRTSSDAGPYAFRHRPHDACGSRSCRSRRRASWAGRRGRLDFRLSRRARGRR